MQDLHADMPVLQAGAPLQGAKVAVVLIHGRGSSPQDMLALVPYLPASAAYLAPTARGATWYPHRFIVPRAQNEPALSSALRAVGRTMAQVSAVGIPPEKTVLVGFSQGACLALEYAVRHPQRYGALVGLSGGLIGADDELTGYEGSLDGTPVLLGCSDVDFHIPLKRVNESARLLSALGANVDERIYPNFGHSINDDEINAMVRLIEAL